MNEQLQPKNKKRNKLIAIIAGITISTLVLFGTSYSYWRTSKKQDGMNEMLAACLDFDLEDVTNSISIDSAWPQTDSQALKNSTGYTFKIKNNCSKAVNYIVGLEALPLSSGSYLKYSSIGIGINNASLGAYSALSDVSPLSSNALTAKELFTDTLKGNESKTYTLKLWIRNDAPVTEQGKKFSGKIIITGGQAIDNNNNGTLASSEDCFTIDSEGQITSYDESKCGRAVKIPTTIDGTQVKSIDTNAFKTQPPLEELSDYGDGFDETTEINSYQVFENSDADMPTYVVAKNDFAKTFWQNIMTAASVTGVGLYLEGTDELPELVEDNYIIYFYVKGTGEGDDDITPIKESIMSPNGDVTLAVDTLDLSQTLYLEKIEEFAFTIFDEENEIPLDGLDGLNFGPNDSSIIIERYAFAKLTADTLTLHSAISDNYHDEIISSLTEINNVDLSTSFAMSDIGTLKIKYDEGHKKFFIGALAFIQSEIDAIVIEEGIEEVGTYTLAPVKWTSDVATISLPSTMKYIRCGAFSGIKLNDIEFPNGLISIGGYLGVQTIDELYIPDTVTEIGEYAFTNITSINSIHISNSLKVIPNHFLDEATSSLNELTIPNSVTSIGEFAFRKIPSIATLTISNKVETIGWNAFQELSSVNNFTLPATLKSVDRNGFGKLTAATTVTIKQANGNNISKADNWLGKATIVYSP